MRTQTQLLLAAILYRTGFCGTLAHSKVYPFVVELNSSSLSDVGQASFAEAFGRVSFNGHAFTCGKAPRIEDQFSASDVLRLERFISLDGLCWDVEQEVGSRNFIQVCIGRDVKEYRLSEQGTKGMMRMIGTSDPINGTATTETGFSETFVGDGKTVTAKYICSRNPSDHPQVTSHSKSETEVSVPTFLVCPSLDDSEIGGIIQSVPPLAMMSRNMFWEYQFMYPAHALQLHRDPTGATENETYSLGSFSDGRFETHQERSLNPAKLFIHPHMAMKLTGGTHCEPQQLERRSTVQFRCPLDWESVGTDGWRDHFVPLISADKPFRARLADVREPEVCEYEMIVETTALCIDPGFVPTQFEISSHSISCHRISS